MLMDDIDRKILKLLQENARMSLKTIAEKNLSVISGCFCKDRKTGKRRGDRRVSCHGRPHEIRVSHFGIYQPGCDTGR